MAGVTIVLTFVRVGLETRTELESGSVSRGLGAGELEHSDGTRSCQPTITLIVLRSFLPPLLDRRGFLGTFLAMPRCDRRAISWGEGEGVAAVSRDRRSCRCVAADSGGRGRTHQFFVGSTAM